jgi:2,3-dihydroxybenzoate-AMP ligase
MFALIEKHRVTHIKVVPALLIRLINDPSIGSFDLGSVQQIQSGGQRMQPEVRLRARELFRNAFVQENFGMSEGLIMFVRPDDPEEVQLETCGRPVCPDDEVKLIDEEGREVAQGETGELACRGPWLARQYYRTDEPGEKFSPDGWLRTGDVAAISPLGYVRLVDRTKDLVKSGGEWISSVELENEIMGHPKVAEAAVIAVAHPKWGERPLACVVIAPGESLSRDELLDYLRERLNSWQVPDDVVFIDEVPKTSVGKFSKKTLRERFADYALPG